MDAVKTARHLIEQAKAAKRDALDEPAAKRVLQAFGIKTPSSAVIQSADDIDKALQGLTTPVVLKLISPDVLHKSDFSAVILGLSDAPAIAGAMRDISQRCLEHGYEVDGFLLEETIGHGHEIVIGGYRDDAFGPVIMFGLGGVFVEILQDVTFRICPITEIDAKEMIEELRGAPLLQGARGGIAVPGQILVNALLAVGGQHGLLVELADLVKELDINPLLAGAQGVTALDARIVFAGD
ncbi:acetate--CoA ligase family protein [Candidimonas nitroreducens]|nr:acetate--CoA ligase family protein [Candidimonas nitroreducens]